MSWNIKTPGDYINGPLTVTGSATITGDLTVDTSTLKVDSANNRVGIGTASPGFALDILGASGLGIRIYESSTGNNNRLQITQSGTDSTFNSTYSAGSGAFAWQVASAELMRLNSTGLGVGGSPLDKFTVVGNSFLRGAAAGVRIGDGGGYGFISAYDQTLSTAKNLVLQTQGSNVGIGVQPSAWSPGFNVVEGAGGALFSGSNTAMRIAQGAYFGSSDYRFKFAVAASRFEMASGQYVFYTSNNTPVIGDAITWTQAMTLTAAGDFLTGGKTAASVTAIGFQTLANGESSTAMASSTGSATVWNVYSTGAAAYRFYVGMNGTISATNTTISAISDARLKENVQDIDVGLGAILALKPRKFDWKEGKGKNIKGDRGFIAQEFEQVFPNLIDEWKGPAPEGEAPYKSVRQDLIPVLVKAIQELTARVVTLENA